MAKTLCKVLGVVLLLVGIAGFFNDHLLGMHLTMLHNIVHLLTAAIALYIGFAGTASAARTFCLAFGAIYLLLGILGFIAPDVVASIIGHTLGPDDSLTPDNAVHLVLGAVFLIAGLQRAPQPATTT
jgi:hypothetical protein